MIVRPMTEYAEKALAVLNEAARDNPPNGWTNTRALVQAGVKGVVDALAVLLDHGVKIRACWDGAGKCCRYRLLRAEECREITAVAVGVKTEVKDAAKRVIGKAVWDIMKDGQWHTPEDVGDAVGISPQRASSAFRRFGYSDRVRYKVEKQWIGPGANRYQYRITEAQACVNT